MPPVSQLLPKNSPFAYFCEFMHNTARLPNKKCKKVSKLNPAKLFLSPLQYYRIRNRCSDVKSSVADPDPAPYVFDLLDPDPHPFVRGTEPALDPSIIKQN
jgi:hypothetical protein